MVPQLKIQLSGWSISRANDPDEEIHKRPAFFYQKDFTSYLQQKWTITKQAYSAKDTFEFTLRDTKGTIFDNEHPFPPTANQLSTKHTLASFLNREVVLVHGDFAGANERAFLFGGIITEVVATSVSPFELMLKFNALGWAYLLDDTVVTATYGYPTSQGNIIGGFSNDSSINHYDTLHTLPLQNDTQVYGDTRSMFRQVEKEIGTPLEHPFETGDKSKTGFVPWVIDRKNIFHGRKDVASRLDLSEKSLSSVLTQFAEASGYVWRIDSDKTLHFRPPNQVPAGSATPNSPLDENGNPIIDRIITFVYDPTPSEWFIGVYPNFPYHKFSSRIDITKLKNHIIIKGGQGDSEEIGIELIAADLTDSGALKRVYNIENFTFLYYALDGTEIESRAPRILARSSESAEYVELTVGLAASGSDADLKDIDGNGEYDVLFHSNLINSQFQQVELSPSVTITNGDPAAIHVEGIYAIRLKVQEHNDDSIFRYGRKTLVMIESTAIDTEDMRILAKGKLYELSQNAEVLKLKVLVDTTGSAADPTHVRSLILRDLDAAKTVRVINPLHNITKEETFLIETMRLAHIGGEVYEYDLTLRRVYPEYLPLVDDPLGSSEDPIGEDE